ncbi:FAD-dependent oxidoreductase [Dyella caseinilytica]|uniref:FAD-dependent monooxygenase n=1 Tax=Dyella caseinilytica TaxID=1849581 RepID=A0ABX7GQ21_9GAMM|nr:NAD(P)/FAD-dependent oxidoreductase [Dyella caseinilytica]QRN52522.1 FAD-dependent monooxygenase [Dyella caseinilytica]GGA06741.1 FAD-dependent oxidoreductase [Dyella caseinilytica]
MGAAKHALIIGGGIAGPAVALALHKAGIRSAIYESYPAAADGVGAGLMLAPNGLEALRIIGVDTQLRAVSQPIHRMVIANSRGKALSIFDGLEGLPASRVIWRSDLYRVLRETVEEAGIPVVYGKRLIQASETADGVSAQFADGSQAFGDILIGADGIRSTVRELIDPSASTPQYAGFLGFGGGTSVDPGQVPIDAMTFVFGKHAFLGYWADPDKGICWFGSLPHDVPLTLADVHKVPAAEWLERLRKLYHDDQPAQNFLRHADPAELLMTGASMMMPPVPRWHSQRMVLVGDAVHAPSSSSGQGASLAIESAVQLARCLRDLPSPVKAFTCYEQLRRVRVEKVAANAAKTNSKKASGRLAKAFTHMLMPLILKVFFNPAKAFGAQHTYRIDWDAPVDSPTR